MAERVTAQINPPVRRKCKIHGQKHNYGQDRIHICKAQVQTENVGLLGGKKLRVSRRWQQSIKPSMSPSKHGALCTCNGCTYMEPALIGGNHFLLPELPLFTKDSPEHSKAFYSTIHNGRREPEGDEAVICYSSEPDPALLLYLGYYLKRKKRSWSRKKFQTPPNYSQLACACSGLSSFCLPGSTTQLWYLILASSLW